MLAALLACALLATGCLFEQRRALNEAREAYDACLRRHPHDAARQCAAERAEVDVRSERYEDDARTVWGCTDREHGCDPREDEPGR